MQSAAGPLLLTLLSKAIELARTLKPDDAMRVRANDVKVAPLAFI
jgi:hypothetical protein